MLKPCHPSEYTLRGRVVRRLLLSVLHPTTLVRFVSERLGRLVNRSGETHARLPELSPRPVLSSQTEPSKAEQIAQLFAERAFKSVENYVQKQPYPGRVTLIVIDRMPLRFLLRPAWGRFARGGVDIHAVRGDSWDQFDAVSVSAKIRVSIAKVIDSQACKDGFIPKGCEAGPVPV
jgi:hypothetical protein